MALIKLEGVICFDRYSMKGHIWFNTKLTLIKVEGGIGMAMIDLLENYVHSIEDFIWRREGYVLIDIP